MRPSHTPCSYPYFNKDSRDRIEDFPLDVDDAIHAATTAPGLREGNIPSALVGGLDRGMAATNEELIELCHSFLNRLRNGTAPWVVQRLNHTYGPEPVDDPSNFSFWMALVRSILLLFSKVSMMLGSNTGPSNRRTREGKIAANTVASSSLAARRSLDRTVK